MTDKFDDVLTQLEPLRFTPARSEAAARSGLHDFLQEAANLRPTVSAPPARRLTGWMSQLWLSSQLRLRSKFTQERSPMLALAIKLVLVLAVMFGGAGVTAAAAQSSLPHEALYPVKLLVEDVQLSLASTPDAQIDVQLEQAQQRVREMAQLTDRGAAIPAEVPARLQTRLQAALQIAAQLDDQQLQPALDRIQLRTQDQLREMDRLRLNEAAAILTQVRDMARLGQSDPQAFRARFGYGQSEDAPPPPQHTPRVDPSRTPQPSHTPQHTGTPQLTRTPQHTPQATNTPQNHSYGPGPQGTPQPGATPVGQGDGNEYGSGPQPTNAPGGGGEPQGNQDGSGGNGPAPEPGGSDTGGGSDGGGGSAGGGSGGGGRP
jgi:uncharacterized membrane protein YgcG